MYIISELTQIIRPDGATVAFGYDTGGRLSNLSLPTGQISYAYNSTTGNLTTLTAVDGGTLAYTYDGGLVTSSTWSGTVSGAVNRTFDNNFRVISDSVNGSQSVTYGYDNDGLLTQAGSLAIGRNLQNGLITGTTLGSLTDSYSYTVFGEVIGYQASFGTTAYKNLQYTRDNLGRITQKVEDGNTYAYSYDLAGRLTDVSLNGVNQAHYTYDGNSNRLSLTTPSGMVSGAYDAQDRLVSYGANNYAYTANGELLTKTNAGGTTNYTYDALGNLTHVSLSNGTSVDYVIDGQNRRIGKKINGTILEGYLYSNQLRIVAETDMNNAIVSRFIYGSKANIPDYMIKGGNTYRIISDHLGSPRLVIDMTTGLVAEAMNYDEFGNVTSDTQPGFQPFGFAGGLYDSFAKLTRFGARDYDAETGRWTSKDPINFKGGDTNLYGYVLADPINGIDSNGLDDGSVVLDFSSSSTDAGPTQMNVCDPDCGSSTYNVYDTQAITDLNVNGDSSGGDICGQQCLTNLEHGSEVGVMASFATADPPAFLTFSAIGATAHALNIALYSDDPVRDTFQAATEMIITEPVPPPLAPMASSVVDKVLSYISTFIQSLSGD